MATLIIYATRYGATARLVEELVRQLPETPTVVDIDKEPAPDLAPFDTVLVGGSIRAGKIQKKIKRFCADQGAALRTKRLGLFLSCMYEGETAEKQLADSYPESLREHATATGLFGGVFDFEKMNFVERAIVKKVAGVTESVERIDSAAITAFAAAFSAG